MRRIVLDALGICGLIAVTVLCLGMPWWAPGAILASFLLAHPPRTRM